MARVEGNDVHGSIGRRVAEFDQSTHFQVQLVDVDQVAPFPC
jgi:hypothetical protein